MPTESEQPGLPHAQHVADELREGIEAWSRRGPAPRFWLRGRQGVGKSWAVSEALDAARGLNLPTLEIRPPRLGLDAVAHLSLQGAGSLREAAVNGVLDPAFAARCSAKAKIDALTAGIREVGRPGLIALDLHDSWSSKTDLPDHADVQSAAISGIHAIVTEASKLGWALVVASSPNWAHGSLVQSARSVRDIPARSEGRSFLESENRWGAHTARAAERLAHELGERAVHNTPLELRVAVGLASLPEAPMIYVRDACEAGFSRLRGLLFDVLQNRKALGRAFATLSLARFPVPDATLELIEQELDSEEDRDVLRHSLCANVA